MVRAKMATAAMMIYPIANLVGGARLDVPVLQVSGGYVYKVRKRREKRESEDRWNQWTDECVESKGALYRQIPETLKH